MSSNTNNTSRSTKSKLKVAGIAAAGLGVAALLVTPLAGANYSVNSPGTVDIQTATLSLSLTDDNHSAGTFDLNYANLAPGQTQTKVFYVTNTGSIAAVAKLGQPVTPGAVELDGLTPTQMSYLKVGVDGVANPASITNLPASFNLGVVNPGETKAVTLRVSLDKAAENEWMDREVGATATVTLDQQ